MCVCVCVSASPSLPCDPSDHGFLELPVIRAESINNNQLDDHSPTNQIHSLTHLDAPRAGIADRSLGAVWTLEGAREAG